MHPCMLDKTSGVRIYSKSLPWWQKNSKNCLVVLFPQNASGEDATPELISNHCLVVKTTGVGDGNYRK